MFEIRQLDDNRNILIVVATGYYNPLSCLKKVAERLEDEAFKGDILFDLLCSNGFESNRFAIMAFDGKSFLRNTFRIVDEDLLPHGFVKKQNAFFAQNSFLLSNSVLSHRDVTNLTLKV
ncbi:type II toxin-antitoxin system RnlB family antitoxin [Rahnella variigena]|uniref:type II toxin-antitoxin system RnlB family antitoxin n=1 Tax=Rahnella variigena TaxID=574964 RepID=UPI00101C5E68|nr:type II toxin-antitoxin system RnlB family antitoxin [Rahnella variigena]